MKYLILAIVVLSTLLYFCIFNLWIPQKYENKQLNDKVDNLYEEIKQYNEKNKIYAKQIKEFKKSTKNDKDYNSWASVDVHPNMLELLQK